MSDLMPPDSIETCSTHTVAIHDRGGERRLHALVAVSSVKWERRRSKLSAASVTISGSACRTQADVLATIEPHRHEMVIWRGGDRVWEGPIIEAKWGRDSVELFADDVTAYMHGTPLSKAWPGPSGGGPPLMTDRIRQIVEYELVTPYTMRVGTGGAARDVVVPRWETIDPPANVLPFFEVRDGTVLTTTSTLAFDRTLGEHLDDLADSGVDYVTVGRRTIFWDSADALGEIRGLTDADFSGGVDIYADGGAQASVAHVSGQRDEADPSIGIGSAGGPDDYYGVWTTIHTREDEAGESDATQDTLNSQASRELIGRTPTPIDIITGSSSTIRLRHDLTINDLVPGVLVPVRATLNGRDVSATKVLDAVTVTDTPRGETVKITLTAGGVAT